jgi:hypothetical protein
MGCCSRQGRGQGQEGKGREVKDEGQAGETNAQSYTTLRDRQCTMASVQQQVLMDAGWLSG